MSQERWNHPTRFTRNLEQFKSFICLFLFFGTAGTFIMLLYCITKQATPFDVLTKEYCCSFGCPNLGTHKTMWGVRGSTSGSPRWFCDKHMGSSPNSQDNEDYPLYPEEAKRVWERMIEDPHYKYQPQAGFAKNPPSQSKNLPVQK